MKEGGEVKNPGWVVFYVELVGVATPAPQKLYLIIGVAC